MSDHLCTFYIIYVKSAVLSYHVASELLIYSQIELNFTFQPEDRETGCWSFTTLTTMESHMEVLKRGLEKKQSRNITDLSENLYDRC